MPTNPKGYIVIQKINFEPCQSTNMSHIGKLIVLFKFGKGRTNESATESILVLLTFKPVITIML